MVIKKPLSGLVPGGRRLPSLPLSRYASPDYILTAFIIRFFRWVVKIFDEIKFQIEGLDEIVKLIGKMSDFNDRIYVPIWNAMGQAGKLLEDQIKQNLTDNDSIVTGDLRGSVSSSEVQMAENAIFVEVGVGRGLSYARVVEYRTRPHTPPLSVTEPGQPLYEFVRVKGIAGKVRTKRIGKTKKDEIQKAARAIWAHIRRSGTKAHPYVRPAFEQTKDRIKTLFEEAVEKILTNF